MAHKSEKMTDYNWRNSKAYFNGKLLADVEVISYNDETMVGLANYRGMLVRFQGHIVTPGAQSSEYAKVHLKSLGDNQYEMVERT